MRDLKVIKNGLSKFEQNKVDIFIHYVDKMDNEKDKDAKIKNYFMKSLSNEDLINMYKFVWSQGLDFDGKHITIGHNGITYDYIAYKNKMLLSYPESKIDLQLVYKTDIFDIKKENGKVFYSHQITNPFDLKESDIIGGYCVIKNSRGEFFTSLSLSDLEKHKKIAKTQYIWNAWIKEMYLRTIFKKASKVHFDDIFESMNDEDNKDIDLEKLLEDKIKNPSIEQIIKDIEKINNLNDLKDYAEKNIPSRTKAISDILNNKAKTFKN